MLDHHHQSGEGLATPVGDEGRTQALPAELPDEG